jgi:hypothetical protein
LQVVPVNYNFEVHKTVLWMSHSVREPHLLVIFCLSYRLLSFLQVPPVNNNFEVHKTVLWMSHSVRLPHLLVTFCLSHRLLSFLQVLPVNYNFEVHKTVWRLGSAGAKSVALQFPEGLLAYAGVIADILERFAGVRVFVFVLACVGICMCLICDLLK